MPRILPERDSEGNISGNEWEDGGVEQIETSDSVLGGPPEQNNQRHSPPNYAFKEIVSRLGYLYQRIEEVARDIPGTIRAATRTVQGIARLASLAQVLEGTDDETIVTPKTLQGKIDNIPAPPLPLPATTTRRGLIELLNNSEGRLGTDTVRAVTAQVMLDALRNGSPFSAGTTFKGVVERLTQAEARLGTDTTRYLTAALLLDALRNGTPFRASESQYGVAQRASQADVNTGTENEEFITPQTFRQSDIIKSIAPAGDLPVFKENSGATLSHTSEIIGNFGIFTITPRTDYTRLQIHTEKWIPVSNMLYFYDSSHNHLQVHTPITIDYISNVFGNFWHITGLSGTISGDTWYFQMVKVRD